MTPIISNTVGIVTRSGPPSGPTSPTLPPTWQIVIQNVQPDAIEIADLKFYNSIIDPDVSISLMSNNFPTQPNQLPFSNFINDGNDVIGIVNFTGNLNQILTIPGQTTYAILKFRGGSPIEQFTPTGENMTMVKKLVNGNLVDSTAVTSVIVAGVPTYLDPDPFPNPGTYDFIVSYMPI